VDPVCARGRQRFDFVLEPRQVAGEERRADDEARARRTRFAPGGDASVLRCGQLADSGRGGMVCNALGGVLRPNFELMRLPHSNEFSLR
jgi:hypothetical protein